jgi:hypothetical protein
MQVKGLECATFNAYHIPNLHIASLLAILNRKIKWNKMQQLYYFLFRGKRDCI